MKKLALALAATAAFAGQAMAADMAARPYAKAPPPPVAVTNWTGCYIGGGGGYGLWNQENTTFFDGPPRTQFSDVVTSGGRGWFGTVQGGCDYQFAGPFGNWVVGAFADYDFADINGRHAAPVFAAVATEKLSSQWAVGGRIGWLVTPSLLTYFSGGYTEATFDRQNYTNLFGPPFNIPLGIYTGSRTYHGWFLGAGDEYALSFLPGLFWKTEYRFTSFDSRDVPVLFNTTGLSNGFLERTHFHEQSIRSELVYRFNWGGAPIAARY